MRRPAAAVKPRIASTTKFPAALGGWTANQNIGAPSASAPQGAAVLENIFPTATGGEIRRGSATYATLGDGTLDTTALFTYNFGNNKKFFGATSEAIYDITTVTSALNYQIVDEFGNYVVDEFGNILGQGSTTELVVISGLTGGDWIDEQFATTGGNFLVIVNGSDPMQIYDGTDWYAITDEPVNRLNYDAETVTFVVGGTLTGGTSGATAVITRVVDNGTTGHLLLGTITGTFQDNEIITGSLGGSATADGTVTLLFNGITGTLPSGAALSTSDFSYVWAFKNRLFFILKDSLDFYFLPVDQIGGAAVIFPMGAEFSLGGKLYIGVTWALDAGNGLQDNCAFITDEGEIVVYAGTDPATAANWQKVGRYQMGKPLGPKAFIRAGGDLVFATDIGFVPMSQALQVDYSVLSSSAISYQIETEWNNAVLNRSSETWDCIVWPEKQMVVVSLPTVNEQSPAMYVANARTGAWGNFTNWSGTCLEIFNGRLFFGSENGRVVEAGVTGMDENVPYTATYVPLFADFGDAGANKIGLMARVQTRGPYEIAAQMSAHENWVVSLPSPPSATSIPEGGEWGTAIWGTSVWGSVRQKTWQGEWQSVGGYGYALAPGVQITSGSLIPLDTEIIVIDFSYDEADWGS